MNLRRTAAPLRQALTYHYLTRHGRRPATTQPIRLSPRLRMVAINGRKPRGFGLPLVVRVSDLLVDAMLAIGEEVDLCESDRTAPLAAARLASQIRPLSDQVNLLMKTISD